MPSVVKCFIFFKSGCFSITDIFAFFSTVVIFNLTMYLTLLQQGMKKTKNMNYLKFFGNNDVDIDSTQETVVKLRTILHLR